MTTLKQGEELEPCRCGAIPELLSPPPHIYCAKCGSITTYPICSVPSHAARLWNGAKPDAALAQKAEMLDPPKSQGLCDTTMTERFEHANCRCKTYFKNMGTCKTFTSGRPGRQSHCAYCDHEMICHLCLLEQLVPSADLISVPKLVVEQCEKALTAYIQYCAPPEDQTGDPILLRIRERLRQALSSLTKAQVKK